MYQSFKTKWRSLFLLASLNMGIAMAQTSALNPISKEPLVLRTSIVQASHNQKHLAVTNGSLKTINEVTNLYKEEADLKKEEHQQRIIIGLLVAIILLLIWLGTFFLRANKIREQKRIYDLQEKQVRDALFLAAIINSSDDAIISKDLNGFVKGWNYGAEKMFGYREEEVLGKPSKIIPAHLREEDELIFNRIRLGEKIEHFETERLTKSGILIQVSINLFPIKDSSGIIIGTGKIIRNISERKKAELELQQLNHRLLLATNSAKMGIWDWNIVENKLIWDDNMCRIYDFPPDNLTPTYDAWRNTVFPEDVKSTEAKIQNSFAGSEYHTTFRIFWPNKSVHYIESRAIIIRDEQGKALRAIGVSWDITDQKVAEIKLSELNEALEQRIATRTSQLTEANKELVSFSYSISHDLRAPLRIINGYASILANEYNTVLGEEANRLVGIIKNNSMRMGNLIDNLLTFSNLGKEELRLSSVEMKELVAEAIAELGPEEKVLIKIGDLPKARCDQNLMKQVWLNLLSNAIKYSAKNEKAIIEIGSEKEGREIVFYVKDNGVGFDMHYSSKLFGVFQRLHTIAEFEGTGIGLAIVYRIVTRHGGRVWFDAQVKKGATFYFSLPA